MRQVAGDYIARDIACAAPDARIVIIATQVRYSMQRFCYCLHTDIHAKIFCHVLTHWRHHHHHPPLFASSLLLLFNALQGGASATIDFAAICRKRIVVTGSLLRPQTQQQKARASPPLRASSSCTPLHLTATRRHCAPVCSTTCGLCSKASSFAAKCVLVCLTARLFVVWSRRSLACFTQ